MAISITYGTYTIPFIIEKFRETISYRNYSLDVDFLISGTDDASFVSALQGAEDALTKDSQKLEIKFGATTHRSFDPAVYSGMRARTTLTKSGNEVDTARSRRYSWHVDIILPANDLINDNYRREATWSISINESKRKEVTFQGTYTAGGGNTAKANYDANIGTWISSVFTALGFTETNFELIQEQINSESDENDILNFNRIYREVLFNEDATTLNNSAIQNATVSFARTWDSETGLKNVGGVRVNINYSCNVDKTDGTYGNVNKLDDLWKTVIRPHLLSQAKTIWGGSLSVIESENTTLDPSQFMIQSNLQVLISGRGNILSYEETVDITEEKQWQYRKRLSGQDDDYIFWTPGRRITANQNISIQQISSLPAIPLFLQPSEQALGLLSTNTGNGFWNLDSSTVSRSPMIKGSNPDGVKSISVNKVTFTRRYTWVAKDAGISDLTILFGGRIVTIAGRR